MQGWGAAIWMLRDKQRGGLRAVLINLHEALAKLTRIRREARNTRNRNVDAVEKTGLVLGRVFCTRSIARVSHVVNARRSQPDIRTDLCLLQRQTLPRKLNIAHPKLGAVFAFMDQHRRGWLLIGVLPRDVVEETCRRPLAGRIVVHPLLGHAGEGNPTIDLHRCPRQQALRNHLGEHAWVGSCLEDLLRNLTRDLMVAVAIRHASHEDRCDDERPIQPDGPNGVVEHAVVRPFLKRFFLCLGKPKVNLGAEELVDAHVAVGGE